LQTFDLACPDDGFQSYNGRSFISFEAACMRSRVRCVSAQGQQ
jgi:hypothetical protein